MRLSLCTGGILHLTVMVIGSWLHINLSFRALELSHLIADWHYVILWLFQIPLIAFGFTFYLG